MGQARQRLSVLILAKNEAARIAACLQRLTWADEVVVVDDMSTDQTAKICRQYGARVVQRQLDTFANQANFGLQETTGDWVLSLDADELVTDELRKQIQAALSQPSDYVGLTFKRMNFFLGHCMRYGGWYHDVLHLFRRKTGTFDGDVHYAPKLQGLIGHLNAHVEHYPFQSLTQFVDRQNRYTSMEAQEWMRAETKRTRAHIRYQIALKPLKLFWKTYVKKQGYREGMHGLVFAGLFAWIHFLKWAKYWECMQSTQQGEQNGYAQTFKDNYSSAAPLC